MHYWQTDKFKEYWNDDYCFVKRDKHIETHRNTQSIKMNDAFVDIWCNNAIH